MLKSLKTSSIVDNLLVLKFMYYKDGNSGTPSSSILSILLCLKWSFFKLTKPSPPINVDIMLFEAYSSSNLGIFLNGAKFLNLLSILLKIFIFWWPYQPSLIFSSLLYEISKYSSLGSLNAASSVNLLFDKSKYFKFRNTSSSVNTETFLILFF